MIFEGLILVTAGYVELLLIPGVDLSSRYPNLQFAVVLAVH